MGTNTSRHKSWTRRLTIPGTVQSESSSSTIVPPASVFDLPQTSSSEYLQQDSNHSDTLSIYALPKNSPNRSSAQSRLSVNPEKEINYYINSNSKDNEQSCHSKLLKVLSRQAVNILYGILGSIVASALSGAIYSIVNSASGQDGILFGNNLTTIAFTHSESSWTSFNGTTTKSNLHCMLDSVDFTGGEISGGIHYNITLAEQCAQLCKETKGCEYWSWIDPERWINYDYPIENYCHLKDDNSGQQDMIGVVSGYKTCPQESTTIPTMKYSSTKNPINLSSSNCSTIQVILKNEPLIKYESYTYGTFEESDLVNGRKTWKNSLSGTAIWYMSDKNQWMIGRDHDIGKKFADFSAIDQFSGLSDNRNLWSYKDNSGQYKLPTNPNDITVREKFGKLGSLCPVMNQYLFGNDLFAEDTGSWEECGWICAQIDDCKYWTWIVKPPLCTIKDASSGYSPMDGVISGPKNCFSLNSKCMLTN